MRVLILGGTNFLGPFVVRTLHGSGHEVTVYHRGQHEPDLPRNVRHIHSPDAGIPMLEFPPALTDPAPDVVIHMYPVGEVDARAAMARFTGVARRIIAISSGDVYRAYGRLLGSEPGPVEPVPLDERAALRSSRYPYRHLAKGPSDWTFEYEKILVERAVLGERSLPGTVLRLPAVYGPGDPNRRLRPYLKRMDDGRSAILLDSAQAAWRWTHGYVEDIAAGISLASLSERAAGQVYNLGEAETPTLLQRIGHIGEVAGWEGSIIPLGAEQLPAHLRPLYETRQDLVVATGKIRKELGYRDTISPAEALRRTIEWERANPPASGDPTASEYIAEDEALATMRGA
jgi:nucleoside-diphosphate-sugar epimerase